MTELSRSVSGSNKNITCDQWFTTLPLSSELLKSKYKLTPIGTIQRDEPQTSHEMLDISKERAIVGTSMFCFDGAKTLISKKKKYSCYQLVMSQVMMNTLRKMM